MRACGCPVIIEFTAVPLVLYIWRTARASVCPVVIAEAFGTTCTVHMEDCEGWWLSSCYRWSILYNCVNQNCMKQNAHRRVDTGIIKQNIAEAFNITCTIHMDDCKGWWLSSYNSMVTSGSSQVPWLRFSVTAVIHFCITKVVEYVFLTYTQTLPLQVYKVHQL